MSDQIPNVNGGFWVWVGSVRSVRQCSLVYDAFGRADKVMITKINKLLFEDAFNGNGDDQAVSVENERKHTFLTSTIHIQLYI